MSKSAKPVQAASPVKTASTLLIAAAILAILVYGMIAAMLGTLLPALGAKFTMSPEQDTSIAFWQGIGLVIASLAVGPLVDMKGKKIGLLLGLGLIAISLFLLPTASGFEMTRALFLLVGLGGGIVVTAANALVGDISDTKRSSMLNLLNIFFGLGGILTPFIGSMLGGSAFILCYVIAALTVVTWIVNAVTPMAPPSGEVAFKFSEMGNILNRPVLYVLAAFLLLYVAAEVGVWNFLVKHLVAQGISTESAQSILAWGFALGLMIGRLIASRILMKINPVTVLAGSSILMAVTLYLVLQTADPTMAAVCVFFAGLSMAPVFPTSLGVTGDCFRRGTATAMGIVITAGWVGILVSSPIIGAIAGTDATQYKTALLILPAGAVIMFVLALALKPMAAKHF
ncbi:MAG: MFS transporter [Bryobacterales bacterium]|nr:MFS transporter [Bryobacterales bacterium]